MTFITHEDNCQPQALWIYAYDNLKLKKKYTKNLFQYASFDFVDDIPKDPLTGGDNHQDGIKSYMTTFVKLLSTFCVYYIILSREI